MPAFDLLSSIGPSHVVGARCATEGAAVHARYGADFATVTVSAGSGASALEHLEAGVATCLHRLRLQVAHRLIRDGECSDELFGQALLVADELGDVAAGDELLEARREGFRP